MNFHYKITLNTIDSVKDFVAKANKSTHEISVLSGRYCVDGKSLLGMFSLNLTHAVEVVVTGEDKEFFEAIQTYAHF